MEEKICENCQCFIQHYRKYKRKYYPINCGHCIRLKVKACNPNRKACEHWEPIFSDFLMK